MAGNAKNKSRASGRPAERPALRRPEAGEQRGDWTGQNEDEKKSTLKQGPPGIIEMIFGKKESDQPGQALNLRRSRHPWCAMKPIALEDANASDLERGVRKASDHGARQVWTYAGGRGVGQHDAEAHGQRVEDLREGGQPHVGVGQRAPVREEGVEAFNGAWQKDCSNDAQGKRMTRGKRQGRPVRSLDALDRPRPMTKSTRTHEKAVTGDDLGVGPREGVARNLQAKRPPGRTSSDRHPSEAAHEKRTKTLCLAVTVGR